MIEIALFVQLLLFLNVCFAYVISRSASLFHPLSLYLLFHGIVFVLRPYMVHYFGLEGRWDYMLFTPTDEHFGFTLSVSSVALLVFSVVCWFSGRIPLRFTPPGLPEFSPIQKRAFFWTMVVLGPFAVYSAFFASEGTSFFGAGNIQMTIDLATGNPIYVNTTGYIAQAHAMLGALTILFIWRHRFRLWSFAPLLLFLGYRAFLGWARWVIITTLLTLALLHLYKTRKKWFRVYYMAVVIPVFVLFQNLGWDRNYVRDWVGGNQRIIEYHDTRTWLEKQDHPDFANFEFLSYVLSVVPEKSRTYTYFSQYLELFTAPVPRILWREKPVGPPIKLVNLNDYGNFVGLTISLAGDGWMSAGWIGLVITMALVGFLLGRLHRWFWWNQDNAIAISIYCLFVPLSLQWFRDGGISIAKFALFTLFPVFLWLMIAKLLTYLMTTTHAHGTFAGGRFTEVHASPQEWGRAPTSR